jgi:hypothetical protein
MNTEKDSEIKRLFSALRREEGRYIPAFEEALGPEKELQTAGSLFWRYKVVAVMAVVLAIALPLIYQLRNGVDPVQAPTVDLYQWESPTDFLMTFPDQTLMSDVPEIQGDLYSWAPQTESPQVDGP